MLMYWALLLFRYVGGKLPEPVFRQVGSSIAFLTFMAMPAKRANMYRNLRVVLSGSTDSPSPALKRRARRLVRRSMASYGQVLAGFVAFERLLPGVWRDTERTSGLEHVDTALKAGRGAIFVTAHFGHWDMAGAALARHFPGKITAVAETFGHSRLNDLVVKQRASYGLGIIPMENVRQMTRVLREGKVLGILADRPAATDEGVSVQFFGAETRFPSGTAVLATLARCPILVGSLRLRDDGRFEGVILPPIEPVRTGDRSADVAATMQLVVNHLEEIIRRAPYQWYMFRNMWPGALESEPNPSKARRRLVTVASALIGSVVIGKAVRVGQTILTASEGLERTVRQ